VADSRYTFDISKIKKGYWPKKERRTNMLTTKQARENQEKYGFNELVEGKKKIPNLVGTKFTHKYHADISGTV